MGRVSTSTLLPIDSWARIMGINPFEFNQIGEGFPRQPSHQCQSVWYQYTWQRDFVSREEIAQAVDEAENAIATELGFWPAPKYILDEPVGLTGGQPWRANAGLNWWPRADLRWKYFIGGGVINRTAIDTSVAIALADNDGDGVKDEFTVTFPTSVTDPKEIGLYFTSADRNAATLDETWRLRPVSVSISGGNATVKGHPSILVLPDLTTGIDAATLNVLDPIYITDVEAHRVFRDTTHDATNPYQGVAIWDVPGSCEAGDCAIAVFPLCLGERSGGVYADYSPAASWPYCYSANRMVVNYLAGYPLGADGQMDREMARIVAHLATALLTGDKCGCERSNRIIHHWRAKPNEGDDGRSFTQREIDSNPFVERNGALWAWKRLHTYREWGVVTL